MARGSHPFQILLRLHLLPGGIAINQLDSAAAVRVHVVLVKLPGLGPPYLPPRLHQLAPGWGELVVDVQGGVGEVAASLGVATSHEAGSEQLPGAVLLPVPDANDEGGVG